MKKVEINFTQIKRKEYHWSLRCTIKDNRGIYHEGYGNSKREALKSAEYAYSKAKGEQL